MGRREAYEFEDECVAKSASFEVVAGPVPGIDQSAYAAETRVLIIAVVAAAAAETRTHVMVDNVGALGLAERRGKDRYGFANQRDVRLFLGDFSEDTSATMEWIPSHGKRKSWRPKLRGCESDAAMWRQLDAKADEAAGIAAKEEAARRFQKTREKMEEASQWSLKVIRSTKEAAISLQKRNATQR